VHKAALDFCASQGFPDEGTARLQLERMRWGGSPVCPKCAASNKQWKQRRGCKEGYYRCGACGLVYTVRTGTIFERSHVHLHKWLFAIHLVATAGGGHFVPPSVQMRWYWPANCVVHATAHQSRGTPLVVLRPPTNARGDTLATSTAPPARGLTCPPIPAKMVNGVAPPGRPKNENDFPFDDSEE
jgi:rubredoxin